MTINLAALAEKLGGQLHGDAKLEVSGVASLASASPAQVSFLSSASFYNVLSDTKAGVVLLKEVDRERCPVAAIVVKDPEDAFIDVLNFFHPESALEASIHPSAIVDETAVIAANVSIGPRVIVGARSQLGSGSRLEAGVVIGSDCQLGEGCVLHPNVTLYSGVTLGDRVIVHAGSVLGADGFSYHQTAGRWRKVPQIGGVSIGSDVEIGALTTIDCGALDDTTVADGVKIDNHVMIAHNVTIGPHTVIAGCSAIAGSSKIGQYCVLGGMSAVGDHMTVVDQTMLMGCARVTANVTKPGIYSSGTGLHARRDWHRMVVRFKQLDQLHKRVTQLEEGK